MKKLGKGFLGAILAAGAGIAGAFGAEALSGFFDKSKDDEEPEAEEKDTEETDDEEKEEIPPENISVED